VSRLHGKIDETRIVEVYSITRTQTEQLETIQKRAVHIIFNFTRGT